jgi:hypothetical protein
LDPEGIKRYSSPLPTSRSQLKRQESRPQLRGMDLQ